MTDETTIGDMFGAGSGAGFLGLPSCDGAAAADQPIALLGAPCATPYASVGAYCAGAPQAIRAAMAGYAGSLHHMDFDLGGPIFPGGAPRAVDCGDLVCDEANAEDNRTLIRSAVETLLERGAVPVVLGGDDSVPIPVYQAFAARGPITVLQIDAHIDWRDKVGEERWGLSSTMRRASEMAQVGRIVQIGQRGLGSARPSDAADAKAWGARLISAREFHVAGVEAAMEQIDPGAEIVVNFDVDALDPSIMPAVIGRAPGGLSYWQAVELIKGAAARGRIAGFCLVEYMPSRDVDQLGAQTAARLLATTLGVLARQVG